MNSKLLLFVVAVLLLGGVFIMSKNQNKLAPVTKTQSGEEVADDESTEKAEEEAMEEETGEEVMEEDGEDADAARVSVTEAGFEPQTVTVKAGTKVVWKNDTQATANVSSASNPTHLVYPPLNLGNFEPGEKVKLVFEETGEYKYHDHLSPTKFGTVVVE